MARGPWVRMQPVKVDPSAPRWRAAAAGLGGILLLGAAAGAALPYQPRADIAACEGAALGPSPSGPRPSDDGLAAATYDWTASACRASRPERLAVAGVVAAAGVVALVDARRRSGRATAGAAVAASVLLTVGAWQTVPAGAPASALAAVLVVLSAFAVGCALPGARRWALGGVAAALVADTVFSAAAERGPLTVALLAVVGVLVAAHGGLTFGAWLASARSRRRSWLAPVARPIR